jgi:transcriptional regulator with XRE-family HTH domain
MAKDASALREIRTRLGLSQAECATVLGIALETFRAWDAGRRAAPEAIVNQARTLKAKRPPHDRVSLHVLADELHVHVRTLRAAAHDGRLAVRFGPRPFFGKLTATATRDAAAQFMAKWYRRTYGDIGHSYEALFGAYLAGAKELTVEDPYIRRDHQLRNFIQVCELCVQVGTIKKIVLVTGTDHEYQKAEVEPKFKVLAESLADAGVEFVWRFNDKIHDREIRTDTGWHIQIGRGLDIYQRTDTWIQIGATNLSVRPCMETKVSIFRNSRP